jgi:hypothetical protein
MRCSFTPDGRRQGTRHRRAQPSANPAATPVADRCLNVYDMMESQMGRSHLQQTNGPAAGILIVRTEYGSFRMSCPRPLPGGVRQAGYRRRPCAWEASADQSMFRGGRPVNPASPQGTSTSSTSPLRRSPCAFMQTLMRHPSRLHPHASLIAKPEREYNTTNMQTAAQVVKPLVSAASAARCSHL